MEITKDEIKDYQSGIRFIEKDADTGCKELYTGSKSGIRQIIANQYLDTEPLHSIKLMDEEGNQRFNTVWSNEINITSYLKFIWLITRGLGSNLDAIANLAGFTHNSDETPLPEWKLYTSKD